MSLKKNHRNHPVEGQREKKLKINETNEIILSIATYMQLHSQKEMENLDLQNYLKIHCHFLENLIKIINPAIDKAKEKSANSFTNTHPSKWQISVNK